MPIRNIVKIDREKCNGCGICVNACVEGAIEMVGGKAQLVSEVYCDGLGACLGKCPQDAIKVERREATEFDEGKTNARLKSLGRIGLPGHDHTGATGHQHAPEQTAAEKPFVCPGSMSRTLKPKPAPAQSCCSSDESCCSSNDSCCGSDESCCTSPAQSQLGNWPVQLKLVAPNAPYFNGAALLVSADCVPFALPDFHERFLADRVLVIGCPKLDDIDLYIEKLTDILSGNDVRSIDVLHMEVPCCFGMVHAVKTALEASGKDIPLRLVKIGIDGQVREITPS